MAERGFSLVSAASLWLRVLSSLAGVRPDWGLRNLLPRMILGDFLTWLRLKGRLSGLKTRPVEPA